MEVVTGIGVLFLVMIVFGISLALTAFWIWMLVSAVQNKGLSDGEKVCWVLAIVFFHFIGSLLYLCVGHPKRHERPMAVPAPA